MHWSGCFGLTNSEDYVLAEYNLAGFEKGTIDAWIAPRRLTISAKYFQKEAGLAGEHHNDEGPAFRCVQLPADIDPLQVTLLSACCFLLLFSGNASWQAVNPRTQPVIRCTRKLIS